MPLPAKGHPQPPEARRAHCPGHVWTLGFWPPGPGGGELLLLWSPGPWGFLPQPQEASTPVSEHPPQPSTCCYLLRAEATATHSIPKALFASAAPSCLTPGTRPPVAECSPAFSETDLLSRTGTRGFLSFSALWCLALTHMVNSECLLSILFLIQKWNKPKKLPLQ